MVRTASATPTGGSCLAERGCMRNDYQAPARPGLRRSFQKYAYLAAIFHLSLLSLAVLSSLAITPAEAASVSPFNSSILLVLLVVSGTLTAAFMIAGSHRHITAVDMKSDHLRTSSEWMICRDKVNIPRDKTSGYVSERYLSSQDLNELMARASHELRTPLNAVIGFADIMQRELLGPIQNDHYRDYIADIRKSGFSLLKATEDTLALTSLLGRGKAADTRPVELAPLLDEVWQAVTHQAEQQHNTVLLPSVAGLVIHCERDALRQAMINLFVHALAIARPRTAIVLAINDNEQCVELKLACQTGSRAIMEDRCEPAPSTVSPAQDRPATSGLALFMARTLLQLQGAEFTQHDDILDSWQARIALPVTPVNPDRAIS